MRTTLIYLDNNASTRPHQVVLEAWLDAQRRYWANGTSPHGMGNEARLAFQSSKRSIAALIGCRPSELLITSGATESNNLALLGVYRAEQLRRNPRRSVLVSAIEHSSVLEVAELLRDEGASVQYINVDKEGRLDLDDLASKISMETLLVSVMAANNEVGTIQPIHEVSKICREFGTLFHSDATQTLGKLPLDLGKLGVDLLSASAHKFHGPKGIGLLFARSGVSLLEQQKGGGHQGGRRSGTIDIAGTLALSKALELAHENPCWSEVESLRERLFKGLRDKVSVERISPVLNCLPNTLSVRFCGIDSQALMASVPMVCCSSGSACSHSTPSPSHVLLAMGLDRQASDECLRFSLSQTTTPEEIDLTVDMLVDAVSYILSVMQEVA